MKISKPKLELVLANQCLSVSDLRNEFSSSTLAKIRKGGNTINTKTAGKLAKRLGVEVVEIIEQEGQYREV